MNFTVKNIKTFIGAINYSKSRAFYQELGFTEIIIAENMSLFKVNDTLAFYLQDYYVKKWCDNSMVFLDIDDVDTCFADLKALDLPSKYKNVKLSPIKDFGWGRVCFLHDPSGVLWQFGQFNPNT